LVAVSANNAEAVSNNITLDCVANPNASATFTDTNAPGKNYNANFVTLAVGGKVSISVSIANITNNGTATTTVSRQNPGGPLTLVNNAAPPVTTVYTATQAGQHLFHIDMDYAPGGTKADVTVTTTCGTSSSSNSLSNPSNANEARKAFAQFIMGNLVFQNAKTVSDLINERLNDRPPSGPQFFSSNGTTHFRARLSDLARLDTWSQRRDEDSDSGEVSARMPRNDLIRRAPNRQWANNLALPNTRDDSNDLASGRAPQTAAMVSRPARSNSEIVRDDEQLNFWIDGKFVSFDYGRSGAQFDGTLSSILVGVDYLLTDWAIVGFTAGFEKYDIDTQFGTGNFKGKGFTFGPYAGIRFGGNFLADIWLGGTLVNYGMRDATSTGNFDATRFFISANLTGTWIFWDALRIAPRATLFYAQEHQNSFRTSNSIDVTSQTVRLGRFSVGPEVGYQFKFLGGDLTVEPFGYIKGEYDFAKQKTLILATGQIVTDTRWGGRIGGGVNVDYQNLSVRLGFSYDAIGRSGLNAWSGQLRASLRF